MELGRDKMKKVEFIYKKIIIFFFILGTTFLMLDVSLNELGSVKELKKEKEEYVSSLQKEVAQIEKEIDDLGNPKMIEKVLRREGYGKEGEVIYILKVPEPVAPISEIFVQEKRKSMMEKFVNFITGRDENK